MSRALYSIGYQAFRGSVSSRWGNEDDEKKILEIQLFQDLFKA